MGFERHHSAWIAASLITVASFVGATVYTQNRLARLDALSAAIETNALPSIEYLSRAAVRLTRLNQLLDTAALSSGRERASTLAEARGESQALDADLGGYWRLAPLPGERAFGTALREDVDRASQLARSAIAADERGSAPAAGADDAKVDAALDRAVGSVLATLDYDVGRSEGMAREVRQVRASTLRMIVVLDAASTTVALFAVLVAFRATRRHDELMHAHNALLATRVTELDRFAGRVAHDVLSPLNTISAGLSLLSDTCDERGRPYIDRSQRALERVKQLVGGLLTFARSGAPADRSSRCPVDAALANVVADCSEMAADKGIVLVVEAGLRLDVSCSVGVLTSIVQNLVQNAIKYMGTRPTRRVAVRARVAGGAVRVEVEDTGPGIPAALQERIFEPFVRGAGEEVAGTGLGLATVKRLAESHGGAVGVRSATGVGTLFWVELPFATPDDGRTSSVTAQGV